MAAGGDTVGAIEYQLILVLSEARKVLILRTGEVFSLPKVSIQHGTRITRALQKAIRERWDLDVIVLDLTGPRRGVIACSVAVLLSLTRTLG
jgi:hypothetical protein